MTKTHANDTPDTIVGHFCPNDSSVLLDNNLMMEYFCPTCMTLFYAADECGDCLRPVVWDETRQSYRHAINPERGCFLISFEV